MAEEHSLPVNITTQPKSTLVKRIVVKQAIAGLTPPQQAEAMVREVWPSVVEAQSGLAAVGQMLIKTVILAPIGGLIMAPLYFKKILPFLSTRYTLTNRRLMIQRGLKPRPVHEVALSDIDDVRIVQDSHVDFYKSATLEVLSKDRVVLTLKGVPESDSFRHTILNTVAAYVPGKSKAFGPFLPASSK